MPRPVVFWVEDNASDVELMRTAFLLAGVDVDFVVAENATHAFRYLEDKTPYRGSPRPPDLVLLDLRLPAISGESVLREFRSTRATADIPIVIFTSSQDARELQRCRDLGATACLTKPGTFGGYAEVVTRIRKFLPLSGENGAIAGEPDPVQPDEPPSSSVLKVTSGPPSSTA